MRVILIFLFVCPGVVSAQSKYLDSLKLELKKSKSDTLTVKLLNDIGVEYLNNYPDSTRAFVEKAFQLATDADFKKGMAVSLNYLGRYYARIGQYSKAADYFLKCLAVSGFSDENRVRTTTYYDLGQLYGSARTSSRSDELLNKQVYFLRKSIDSFRLLKPSEKSGDLSLLEAGACVELGRSYMNGNIDSTKLDSAIYYFNRATQLSDSLESFELLFLATEGIGNVYQLQHQYQKMLQIGYQLLSLSRKHSNDLHYKAATYMKLGEFHKLYNFDSANYYLNKSLLEMKQSGNQYQTFIPAIYSQLGQLYFHYKSYPEAIRYFTLEREFSKKLRIVDVVLSYNLTSEAYKALGDYKRAYDFLSRYIQLKDSLLNEDTSARLARLQGEFEMARQVDQIELLEKEAQVNELLLAQKQNQQILVGVVALLLLILIGVLIARNRFIQKSKREQKALFTEMDQLKSRFFANISHEFRTPLTLLLGPIEKHLSIADNQEEKAEFSMMHRNGMRLLTLVNQLLDLSRFEAGTMKLHASRGEVIEFVTITMSEFQSIADSKNIQFKLVSAAPSLMLYYDEDKLKKILSNLFSNAFKFTPEGGSISVAITENRRNKNFENGFVEIKVSDSGIGIEPEYLTKIFERFYQIDNSTTRSYEGSGIGLSLTKELVELHGGVITAYSQPSAGTSFCVQLPLGVHHLKPEEIVTKDFRLNLQDVKSVNHYDEASTDGYRMHNDLILVIEDNADLRIHLQKELSRTYNVILAQDGEEGVQRAIEEIPSLIISDLMMPKKDGLTVCTQLKNDERTSHIPFILLTAKADVESRLGGLRNGSDDYIAKPFSMNELSIRIHNLIEGRKLLQKKYAKQSIVIMPGELTVESVEDKFLKKANSILERYLSDTSFSVEVFAREIGMSQVQLYRKLTALTNYSPNEFIRHMRLQRAADLILQRAGNISEVAYQSGFSNLSYFAKVFKEKFGVAPSEYLNEKSVS